MGSSSDGKVRCEHCNKAYAWQEKYAGKKVRCKCGQVMRFPAQNPAANGVELELNLDSGIDLNLGSSAQSKPANQSLKTPDGKLNVPPPANMGGPSCPSCKSTVRPGAVICVNCGFHLKEGSKINTAVGVQMTGGGRVYDEVADGIFGRFKRSWTYAKISYGMIWDFKQLLIFPICSGIAALLVLVSFAIPVLVMGFAQAKSDLQARQPQAMVQPADTATTPDEQAPPQEAVATRQLTDEEQKAFTEMRKGFIDQGMSEAEADKSVADAKAFMLKVEQALTGKQNGSGHSIDSGESAGIGWLLMWGLLGFSFYFCNYFVIVFFNTALVACAMKIMAGEVPTVGYGLKVAMKRLPQIMAWAFVSAIVGMILNAIENSHEKVGQIIAWILGAGWMILTFFVVPVIAVEGVGPFKAIKTSVSTLKEAWGDSIRGNFSMGLMTFIVTLPVYLLMAGGLWFTVEVMQSTVAFACLLLVCLTVLALIAVASSAADTVFKAILYSFASGKALPAGFDTDVVASAFAQPRRRGLLGLLTPGT